MALASRTKQTLLLLIMLGITILSSCGCARSVIVSLSNIRIENITKKGKRYVVEGEADLKGQTLVLPKKSVLDCRKGILTNGVIVGAGNRIVYDKPFIGKGLAIDGCYVDEEVLRSENILIRNTFMDQDVHNVFNLAKNGAAVFYEKGTYKEVTPVSISKNISIDFSVSIIEPAIDKYELSGSVFLTQVQPKKLLKNVTIKNVVIDGLLPRYGIESGVGPRRNAIRLIKVKNVKLDNVTIRNFRLGTGGSFDKNIKKRHMAGVCAIMEYGSCTIQNCTLSMNTGEGFYLVPGESNQNFLLFKGNKSIRNYGTFLTLVDGRCLVEDNEMDSFGLSGMNVFCYNSVIRNNHFRGGERFNCIDITENGIYWPKDVEIYGNEAEGCAGFVMASGENISITNNQCINSKSGFALTVFGFVPTSEESSSYLHQRNRAGEGVSLSVLNNQWSCKGGIATNKGCNGILTIKDNIITIVPDKQGDAHRGTVLELNDCRDVTIDGNTFNNSFRNSITRSNVYITMNGCRGRAAIRNNHFEQTKPSSDNVSYFLFTKETTLEQLSLEGNTSNVKGISARAVEGKIPVNGNKVIRNNGSIIVRGVALE